MLLHLIIQLYVPKLHSYREHHVSHRLFRVLLHHGNVHPLSDDDNHPNHDGHHNLHDLQIHDDLHDDDCGDVHDDCRQKDHGDQMLHVQNHHNPLNLNVLMHDGHVRNDYDERHGSLHPSHDDLHDPKDYLTTGSYQL